MSDREPWDIQHWILGSDHKPIEVDLMTWGQWFGNIDNRRVAEDVGPGWRLSSVFLGLDHGWGRAGRPILFETMLFGDDKYRDYHGECQRYATWDECLDAHNEWVERLRA